MTKMLDRDYLRNIDALLREAMHPGSKLNEVCQEEKLFNKLSDKEKPGILETYIELLEKDIKELRETVNDLCEDSETLRSVIDELINKDINNGVFLADVNNKIRTSTSPDTNICNRPWLRSFRPSDPQQRTLF